MKPIPHKVLLLCSALFAVGACESKKESSGERDGEVELPGADDGGENAGQSDGGTVEGAPDGSADTDGGVDGGDSPDTDGGTCDPDACGANSACGAGPECECDDGYVDDGWPGVRCVPAPKTVWSTDFESGFGEWSSEGGVWTAGAPTFTEGPMAHGGSAVAGTVLDGLYPNNTTSRLVSPSFAVPDDAELPRLRYWAWHDLRAIDRGSVEVRVFNANTQTWGNWSSVETVAQQGSVWAQRILQLGAYRGSQIQVSFELAANNGPTAPTRAGFYIDDVSFETGSMVVDATRDFEQGFGDWSSHGGMWQVGAPTLDAGPKAHTGTAVAGTVLAGIYPNNYSTELLSPAFRVPAGDLLPRLRYWAWHDLRDVDFAQVKVRVVNANTGRWGNWEDLETLRGQGSGWTPRTLQLAAYEESTIQIAFELTSNNSPNTSTRAGFYVDGVTLETGPMNVVSPEGFEAGFGDWSSFGGAWQVGAPTFAEGPEPHGGSGVVGTVLDGLYRNNYSPSLLSPAFKVPEASTMPRARYWSWHDLRSIDSASVQVRTFNPSTRRWGNWARIENLSGTSSGWTQRTVELAAYGGSTAQLAFTLDANNGNTSTRAGFYIDDFTVDHE
jgi:hypothetical protein